MFKFNNKALKFKTLIVVFFVLFSHFLWGVNPRKEYKAVSADLKFKKISVEDGLSQSTVFAILQDKDGFMWFGTRSGGLNKYDGYTFTVYKNDRNDPNSISNNEIIALFQDSSDRMWVGTRKGGVNLYNKDSDNFQQFLNSSDSTSIAGNTVNAIFEDREHRLWIGTSNGLDLFKDGVFLHHQLPGIENQFISSIAEDEEGNLYITDKDGLFVYNKSTKSSSYVLNVDLTQEAHKSNYSVPVVCTSKGQLLIGCSFGVRVIDQNLKISKFEERFHLKSFPYSETRKILEDAKGNLWIGTIEGLYKYIPATNQIFRYKKDENNPYSINHNSIYSIYEDQTGIIWIGTWGGGVNMVSDKLWKFNHYFHQNHNSESLSDNVVSSFAENKQGIWIGTELGGLNLMLDGFNHFKSYQHSNSDPQSLSSNHIKTLFVDSKNRFWIGTFGGGLDLFNAKSETFQHYLPNEKVFAICEDTSGYLWIGTLYGLYRYRAETNEWKLFQNEPGNPYSLSHNFVDVLYTSRSGQLWIGTKEAGLMKYNAKLEQFVRYRNNLKDMNSILSDYIISITEDNRGNLIIGTDNGLDQYDSIQNAFIPIALNQLPDKNINGVLCDNQNNYWIATNNGMTKLMANGSSINYGLKDGLQSNEFNRNAYFKSRSGMFLYGGINGFNSFYPDDIKANETIPRIVITDLKIANVSVKANAPNSPLSQSITETKKLTLNYKQTDVSFDFVALNYINPEKNQYAYQLEGFNNNWVYAGTNRSANFTNLKPGDYIFRVKGANSDNVWNKEGASIAFSIHSPPWKTPWAITIYFIALFGIFWLIRKIMVKRIEEQNILKNERLEKLRIEELNQTKLRFFTNIAHEFRTPLTLIAGPLSKISSYQSHNDEQNYLISIMQNNVNRLLNLVNELMDFRKAENSQLKLHITKENLYDFINQHIECFRDHAIDKGINLEFESQNKEALDSWFDKGIIDKVVFNILSNAFKYTHQGGTILVRLSIENGEAMISIRDNGIGISKESLDKIYDRFFQIENKNAPIVSGTGIGLSFAKGLIQAHRGKLIVDSEPGKGSVFTIIFPIQQEVFSEEELKNNFQNLELEHPLSKPVTEVHLFDKNVTGSQKFSKLLIVEDHISIREFLTTHFKNYKTLTASNGKEGYDLAIKELPDLIVSDIMMPEMDGLELCKKLKSQLVTSHIPVVLLTARTDIGQKIEGIEMGADAYIEKPFDINLLEATIKNLIQQRLKLKKRFSEEPDLQLTEVPFSIQDKKFVKKVNAFIEKNISDPDLSVESLAYELNMSRSQLFRKIRDLFDLAPGEIIRIERLKKSRKLLAEMNHNVNEVAELTGFKSTSYYITAFKRHFGQTPNEFRTSLLK